MRITLLAIGTRGDVQPLLALGAGLQRTGRHRVCFVAPDDLGDLVRGAGLDSLPLGIKIRDLLDTGALGAFVEPGGNLVLGMRRMLRQMGPLLDGMMERAWQAGRQAEALVFSTMGFGAYHVAEKLGIPCFWALPFPGFSRTGALPSMAFPSLPLGSAYNRLTHVLSEVVIQQLTGRFLNRWRRERLDLPPISTFRWPYGHLAGRPLPRLYSFSPILFPKPADWDQESHVTGYWFLDHPSGWQPPAGLEDFLGPGSPPVYAGFGSLPQRDPQQMARIVVEALRRSGQRGVVAAGWGGLDAGSSPAGSDLHFLESIPHDWLFSRTAAVVHHGGSGTTGAALRAGVPSVIVPHAGDQWLWGRRVAELGAGPEPIPRRELTAGRLAAAIHRAVTDGQMRARAAELGEQIRAEDGVARAVTIIEQGLPGR